MNPSQKLASLFKINGKPVHFSKGELEIFETVLYLKAPRTQIIAPTQYGKSMTIALAVLTSAVSMGERFTILAPSEKKAGIIMNYAIDHVFDSKIFLDQLSLDDNINLDRLRRERTRTNLTFKSGGGIMVLTLDARNSRRSIESALGFGGNRIILDESSLIEDMLYSTVKRMLGGYEYKDTFLLEIGNPFYRNHFFRTWHSNNYKKVFIDYKQGLEEGRYSQEFIDEMRHEAFFDIFYECKFPPEDTIDAKGYRTLIPDSTLDFAIIPEALPLENKSLKLGADIGGGGDKNVYVIRSVDQAFIAGWNRSNDTMTNVTEIVSLMEKYNIQANDVFIDDIGVGRGVTDRLKELDHHVNGISVGAPPTDNSRYKNIKAEASWLCKSWLENGGKLVSASEWRQLNWLRYKVDTDKVLSIEPKDELKQRNSGVSPDFADALILTFAPAQPSPDIAFV